MVPQFARFGTASVNTRRKPTPSYLHHKQSGRGRAVWTDAQWKRLVHLVPKPKPGGRPPKYARREIVNAVLYQAREG